MEIMRRTPWSRIREQNSVYKEFLEIVGNGKPTGSVWKETIVVSATIRISVEKLLHQIRLQILSCSRVSEKHREPEVPEAEAPVVERLDGLARITLEELAITHFVKNGTLQNACSTRPRVVVGLGMLIRTPSGWWTADEKVQIEQWQKCRGYVEKEKLARKVLVTYECHDRPGKPGKRSDKKLGQNSSKRQSSDARQLGCVFQDMTPSKSILRKGTDMPKPIQRVRFTKAFARHTKIRDQNPSLGYICPGEPHQRSPNAPKLEDRSLEETEWQEQGAREAVWKLAKNVLKLKEHQRATFFSPSENRCLPASTLKLEEREFVVDSGASIHMNSKKDLSDAEMDTLTKSCSPMIVITANGEVQTHEEATVYVKELDIFLTVKVLENTPAVLSLGKLCDENGYSYEWINGQKPHLIKDGIRIQYSATRRTSFLSWFQACQVRPLDLHQLYGHPWKRRVVPLHLLHPHLLSPTVSEFHIREREDGSNSGISPVQVSTSVDDRSRQPDETTIERGNSLDSEIPEWLQEFRENLVDDEIPEHGDSHASSSHEISLEPTFKRREDLCKRSVYSHFPKDRNCEICKRIKITRAPCRRRNGGAVPRAVNFGDLIIADHKVLSDNCESRNNHRYAVVVQDFATQWIQAYPCKNKNFTGTQRSLQKFLEPERKPKVIYTDNSLEFGKACEDLSWNHCTSTPHGSETNGIAERAVRRVKQGTSAVLLQSGLNESWWADSMECYTYLRNVTDLWSDGKTPYERRFGQPFQGPIIPFGSLVEYHPITAKDQSRIHPFGKKVLRGLFLGYALYAGNLEGWRADRRPWGVGNDGRIGNLLEKTQCERSDISQTRRIFSNRRWTNQNPLRRSGTENTHLGTASTNSRRK